MMGARDPGYGTFVMIYRHHDQIPLVQLMSPNQVVALSFYIMSTVLGNINNQQLIICFSNSSLASTRLLSASGRFQSHRYRCWMQAMHKAALAPAHPAVERGVHSLLRAPPVASAAAALALAIAWSISPSYLSRSGPMTCLYSISAPPKKPRAMMRAM